MSINLATRGMTGGAIGLATAGKFNSSLLEKVLKVLKTWVAKPIKFMWTSKDLLGR